MQNIHWKNYYEVHRGYHTVVGNVKIGQNMESTELQNRRDIVVYLPPSYTNTNHRYPVLYMHDGQNLFDQATSFVGEWRVDETMEHLGHAEQLEAIVVGIPNMGARRLDEYSPFPDPHHGGGFGNFYLSFITQTLKPLIDRDFRTVSDRANTGIMGSSMGGLISLYGFFRHPEVFGFAGAMSPSLWFAESSIFSYIESAQFHPGKIYLDAGTREMGHSWPEVLTLRARSRKYYASVRSMKGLLVRKGYRPTRDLLHVESKWATHSEAAWADRLPTAIRFFLRSNNQQSG